MFSLRSIRKWGFNPDIADADQFPAESHRHAARLVAQVREVDRIHLIERRGLLSTADHRLTERGRADDLRSLGERTIGKVQAVLDGRGAQQLRGSLNAARVELDRDFRQRIDDHAGDFSRALRVQHIAQLLVEKRRSTSGTASVVLEVIRALEDGDDEVLEAALEAPRLARLIDPEQVAKFRVDWVERVFPARVEAIAEMVFANDVFAGVADAHLRGLREENGVAKPQESSVVS